MTTEPQTAPRPTLDTRARVREAFAAADGRQASELLVLNLGQVSGFADYFLIASGGNERQVQAIADAVDERLRSLGVRPLHTEGQQRGQWVLLDYGDLVVHVFLDEARRFYALERLWSDAPNETADFRSPAP